MTREVFAGRLPSRLTGAACKARTDVSGTQDASWNHYPFGEEWTSTGGGSDQHRFTGHMRDTESGNEYAGARYLESGSGRWLAADEFRGSGGRPQTLNRFSYSLNDPVNYRDPDGRMTILAMCTSTNESRAFAEIHNLPTSESRCARLLNNYEPETEVPQSPPEETGSAGEEIGFGLGEFLDDDLLAIGRALLGQVEGNEITSCEALARYFEQGEGLTNDRQALAMALGRIVGGSDFMEKVLNLSPAAGETGGAFAFTSSGFRPEFFNLMTDNQVRHATGAFVAGFMVGAATGLLIMDEWRHETHPEDRRVNSVMTALGADCAKTTSFGAPFSPPIQGPPRIPNGQIGNRIRSALCEEQ